MNDTIKEHEEIMSCNQIKVGMVFDGPNQSGSWVVQEIGDYKMSEGVRVPIDNKRSNKWWCKKQNSDEPAVLSCFDMFFDNSKVFHFRNP